MPIADMIQAVLAAKSDNYIEPVVKNRYRLYLQVDHIINLLGAQSSDNKPYLQTIRRSMVGNEVPLEVSFTPPPVSVEARTIRGNGNVQVKYGGWTTYGNADVRFLNWVALDTYRFFYNWATIAGALYLRRQDVSISTNLPNRALAVPSVSAGGPAAYKCNAVCSAYGTPDTLLGEEMEYGRWLLEGLFPTSASVDAFDHSDEGDPVFTTVAFSCDLCLPVNVGQIGINIAQGGRTAQVARATLVT